MGGPGLATGPWALPRPPELIVIVGLPDLALNMMKTADARPGGHTAELEDGQANIVRIYHRPVPVSRPSRWNQDRDVSPLGESPASRTLLRHERTNKRLLPTSLRLAAEPRSFKVGHVDVTYDAHASDVVRLRATPERRPLSTATSVVCIRK